jgi:pyruvate ferredoxin oxidoreductase beta subunit
LGVQILDAAVNSCFWPLYEVVDGEFRLTYVPEEIVPIEDWLRPQKRFAHLLRPENVEIVEEIQRRVTAEWLALRSRCEGGVPV